MLIAEQTIATRRKSGAHRFLFFETHDQHDFAKVNARIGTVKIFFQRAVPIGNSALGGILPSDRPKWHSAMNATNGAPLTPEPPIDLLLPKRDLRDFFKTLPELGQGFPYVAIRQMVGLTRRALRDVRGLYASTSFLCRTPAPFVRELLVDAAIDEQTARCFTGLVDARLGSGLGGRLKWFGDSKLEGLALSNRSASDWPSLRSLSLTRLSLTWTAMPMEHLPSSLRWLNLGAFGRLSPRQLEPLAALTHLETLRLTNVDLGTLASVGRLGSLTSLSVDSTRSLRGIGRIEGLRSLHVGGTKSPPISPLLECHALRELSIRARTPPEDLNELRKLVGLEKLNLDFLTISGLAELDSLGFLRIAGQSSRAHSPRGPGEGPRYLGARRTTRSVGPSPTWRVRPRAPTPTPRPAPPGRHHPRGSRIIRRTLSSQYSQRADGAFSQTSLPSSEPRTTTMRNGQSGADSSRLPRNSVRASGLTRRPGRSAQTRRLAQTLNALPTSSGPSPQTPHEAPPVRDACL